MAAQHRGAGDDDGVSRTVHTSLVLAFVLGLLVAVLPLLLLHNVSGESVQVIVCYRLLLPLALLLWTIVMVGIMLMYGLGNTLCPLFILLISGVVRVGLSFVFVRFSRMDFVGVALANLISQITAAALLLLILTLSSGPERIKWSGIRIHARELKSIAAIGIPVMITSTALVFTNELVDCLCRPESLTELGVVCAGDFIVKRVRGLMSALFVLPMYCTAMVFSGQNSGAGKYDRVLTSTLICALLATVTLALSGAAGMIYDERLIGFFFPHDYTPHPEAIVRVKLLLYLVLPVFSLCGLMQVFTGALIGLGKWRAAVASCVTPLGSCIFGIIWGVAVFPQFRSLQVLMIYEPISWGIVALVNGAIFFIVVGRRRKCNAPQR